MPSFGNDYRYYKASDKYFNRGVLIWAYILDFKTIGTHFNKSLLIRIRNSFLTKIISLLLRKVYFCIFITW